MKSSADPIVLFLFAFAALWLFSQVWTWVGGLFG